MTANITANIKDKLSVYLKIFFTILIVVFPLFSMYRFFDTFFSVADIMTFIWLIFLLIVNIKNLRFDKMFICIAAFMVLSMITSNSFGIVNENTDIIDLIGSTGKLVMIYYLVSIHSDYFDFKLGKRLLILISILSTSYLIIQFILARFDIFLPGGIPIFEYFRDEVKFYVEDVDRYIYRPCSLFEEPAHFCQYVIVAVILLLFDSDIKKIKTIITALFLILGIIISMSFIGWLSLLFMAFVFILLKVKSKIKWFVMGGTAILLGIIILLGWDSNLIQQVLVAKLINQNIFEDGRFAGFYSIGNELIKKPVAFLFGNGLGESDVYYNGVLRIFYSFGFVGAILAIVVTIYYFGKYSHRKHNLAILLLLLFLTMGTEIIFGKFLLVYTCFLQKEEPMESIEIGLEKTKIEGGDLV